MTNHELNEIPRRICVDRFVPAERAIYDAVTESPRPGPLRPRRI